MRDIACRYFLLLVILVSAAPADEPQASALRELSEAEAYGIEFIHEDMLFAHLNYIASNLFEGRGATERGAELTAEYAAALFRTWGLWPVGDDMNIGGRHGPSYFQRFQVVEFDYLPSSTLHVESQRNGTTVREQFVYEVDFTFGSVIANAKAVSAPVVFVGYGLQAAEENFDELRGVDVKDRVVVLMHGVPRPDDGSLAWNTDEHRSRYRNVQERIRRLEGMGAVGILTVRSPHYVTDLYDRFEKNIDHHHPWFNRYYEGDEPIEPRRRMRLAESEGRAVPVFDISRNVANAILRSAGTSLDDVSREIDERLRPQSQQVRGVRVSMQPQVEATVLWTNNVLGMIDGSDPALRDEVIVVGAHYDHDGKRGGYIWNGADDNGSGTAGVLALAHAFATAPAPPRRPILFALWGAEEKGLLGSYYFVDNPVIPLENVMVKKNLDMIGRDQHRPLLGIREEDHRNHVFVTVSEHLPLLAEITNENNAHTGLDIDLRVRDVSGGGSDHVPFARRGIPITFFFTGFHEDYHQPSDTVEKINFGKMTRIVRLAYLNIRSLADFEGILRQERGQ
jgi:hypothetical protein